MNKTKTSNANKRAAIKYAKNNLKRVPLDLQVAYYTDILKPAADAAGLPVTTFVKQAIQEKIDRMLEEN